MFYRHMHAESCPLSIYGDEVPGTEVDTLKRQVADLTRRLEEAQGLVTKAQDLATTRGEAIATLTERWTERRRFYKTKYREARKQRDALQAKFAAVEQERDRLKSFFEPYHKTAYQTHCENDQLRTALLALPVYTDDELIEVERDLQAMDRRQLCDEVMNLLRLAQARRGGE